MTPAFIPNPRFERELDEQEGTREALVDAAKYVARNAGRLSVPAIMPEHTRDRFEVQEDDEGVYLVNTDYGGAIEEWGSVQSPPYAPLRRAVEASTGIHWREGASES